MTDDLGGLRQDIICVPTWIWLI